MKDRRQQPWSSEPEEPETLIIFASARVPRPDRSSWKRAAAVVFGAVLRLSGPQTPSPPTTLLETPVQKQRDATFTGNWSWRFLLQKQLSYLPLEVLEGSACKHIFKLQLSFLVRSALQAHAALGHFLGRRSHGGHMVRGYLHQPVLF